MILIDNRAGSRELCKPLSSFPLPCKLTRLAYGDLCWTGMLHDQLVPVGVEFKRLDDCLACITNGRFAGHQLPGMMANYDYVYLIVEGSYRPGPKTGLLEVRRGREWMPLSHGRRQWSWGAVNRWMTTLRVEASLDVRHTFNRRETIQLLASEYRWWTAARGHRSHQGFDWTMKPSKLKGVVADEAPFAEISGMRWMAACIPDIGWVRSEAVEAAFGTPEGMIAATLEEWAEIRAGKRLARLGEKAAARVWAFLHGEPSAGRPQLACQRAQEPSKPRKR